MPILTSESKLTKQQYKSFGPRPIKGYGEGAAVWAHVRYDDECGNGHNTFSITGSVRVPKQRDIAASGCIHEEITEAFPELAHLIKWHLCSSDGPMHYIANTVHFASEKDCWGKLKGEPYGYETHIVFGSNPIKHKFGKRFTEFLKEYGPRTNFDFEVLPLEHDKRAGETYDFAPKYTFGGFAEKWHECPFDTESETLDFLQALQTCEPKFVEVATQFGKGKARELDSARNAAIWPDATDEELTAPGLEQRLQARLPQLLTEFRAAMELLGFTW